MPLIILTQRNVAALKHALIATFPTVKSGHADEAIAAGIGFKTHAALLAAMKVHGPSSRLHVLVSELLVTRRLAELGYPTPNARKLAHAFGAAHLPDSPHEWAFVELRNRAANVANQN